MIKSAEVSPLESAVTVMFSDAETDLHPESWSAAVVNVEYVADAERLIITVEGIDVEPVVELVTKHVERIVTEESIE